MHKTKQADLTMLCEYSMAFPAPGVTVFRIRRAVLHPRPAVQRLRPMQQSSPWGASRVGTSTSRMELQPACHAHGGLGRGSSRRGGIETATTGQKSRETIRVCSFSPWPDGSAARGNVCLVKGTVRGGGADVRMG